MSRPDTSIDPRILESARCEFLACGYEDASLKTICANANVTTGALYKRYKGKEDLFLAVVKPTLDDLYTMLETKRIKDPAAILDQELFTAWDMKESYMLWWFTYLYERRDNFVLLLRCSQGTSLSNFAHDFVVRMSDASYEYYLEAKHRGLSNADITVTEMHILLSSFWTTVYEPFIHDFTWEEIVAHSAIVCRLFNWYQVLGFSNP